jgi:tetraacyldisaccharide 4'-kinase
MNPLSALFGAAVATRNALYDRRLLPARRLQGPVISIGNLSVGGAGKTPFLMLLGELLAARGVEFDVLSRGYGRRTRGVAVVEPGGVPADFGDEPLLMARKLGVTVLVGEDRYAAGVEAERRFGPRLHLLDDGFQHRALARDFDIVLVTPDDARGRLLPVGRLREPLSALRRADAVVLTSGAEAAHFPLAEKVVWRARRGIVPRDVPQAPVAFCGIARPRQFFLQLRAAGIQPAAEAAFRDHHAYREQDIRDLYELARANQAGGFVTTEKDAVNLGGYFSSLHPLAVVPVRMELEHAPAALDHMLRVVGERRRRPA